VDRMKENRLRWFGHVMKRDYFEVIRSVEKMNIEGKRERGKTKKKWLDTHN